MELIVQFGFPLIVQSIPNETIVTKAISHSKQLSAELKTRLPENNKTAHMPKIAQIISNWKSLFCSIPEWPAQSFLDNILNNELSKMVKLSIKV